MINVSPADKSTDKESTLLGNITDENGKPVIGANIALTQGDIVIKQVSSDSNGHFEISVEQNRYDIQVKYYRKKTQIITGIVLANKNTLLNMALEAATQYPEEIVRKTYNASLNSLKAISTSNLTPTMGDYASSRESGGVIVTVRAPILLNT